MAEEHIHPDNHETPHCDDNYNGIIRNVNATISLAKTNLLTFVGIEGIEGGFVYDSQNINGAGYSQETFIHDELSVENYCRLKNGHLEVYTQSLLQNLDAVPIHGIDCTGLVDEQSVADTGAMNASNLSYDQCNSMRSQHFINTIVGIYDRLDYKPDGILIYAGKRHIDDACAILSSNNAPDFFRDKTVVKVDSFLSLDMTL
jgi:hypothetical protein